MTLPINSFNESLFSTLQSIGIIDKNGLVVSEQTLDKKVADMAPDILNKCFILQMGHSSVTLSLKEILREIKQNRNVDNK